MRVWRMGFAASSGVERPRPMTCSPVSVSVALFWVSEFGEGVARLSSSGGKWLIQEEQKSRIRPLRGRTWA